MQALGVGARLFHVEHVTREEFQQSFDVPRGTMERLDRYEALLREWQTGMNLVGPATLSDIWGRHFADSAQLSRFVPAGRRWLDIGAGGGFPGLVLAAMDWGEMILVESIAKKCRFLEAARSALGLEARILNARVEALPTLGVDVVTARAAAPLVTLLDWALRHLKPGGAGLFPKGRRWEAEVEEARQRFAFALEPLPSLTDPEARILKITGLKRA